MVLLLCVFLLAHSSPTTQQLLSFVIPHVASKWYEVGVMLLKEEQESQLLQIESNYSQDVKKCCFEMFRYWRQTHPNDNWYHVVAALKSPGVELHLVAADIEKKFAGNEIKLYSLLCISYKCFYVVPFTYFRVKALLYHLL